MSGTVEQQPLLNGGTHSSESAAAGHQAIMGAKGPTFRQDHSQLGCQVAGGVVMLVACSMEELSVA